MSRNIQASALTDDGIKCGGIIMRSAAVEETYNKSACGPPESMGEERGRQVVAQAFTFLDALRRRYDRVTADYLHSAPMVRYAPKGEGVCFDLRDIITTGALTQSDVLLTGKTGAGKTRLANGTMAAFFGSGNYFSKTALPTMSQSEFMDIDFRAIVRGTKSLQQAISGITSLAKPGMVLNEVNRAPGVIQSLLIPILDHELEVQGVPVEMGIPWKGGRYQFRILTINENGRYQVQEVDPAIRDRMTIEIPIDNFPQSRGDVMEMLNSPGPRRDEEEAEPEPDASHLEQILWLKLLAERLEVQPRAAMFLGYLSGLSYCIRAPQGTKESVYFAPELCEGCHHYAQFYNLCGNIMAPSSRALLKLKKLAQAFALLRAWKTRVPLILVTEDDILQAAPFVLYSKLSLTPLWVRSAGGRRKTYSGDRWTAITDILAWIHTERFQHLADRNSVLGDFFWQHANPERKITLEHYKQMYKYLTEVDPWAYNPAIVRTMLSQHQEVRVGAAVKKG